MDEGAPKKMIKIQQGCSTDTAFLATIAARAAKLQENELLSLDYMNKEMLQALIISPAAQHVGEMKFKIVNDTSNKDIPDLLAQLPQLTSLRLVKYCSVLLDLASEILEHPRIQIHKLDVCCSHEGDCGRFFAALQQSQVTNLSLSCGRALMPLPSAFRKPFSDYLVQGTLIELSVSHYDGIPLDEFPLTFAQCNRLKKMELVGCDTFADFHHLPHSLTKLSLLSVKLPQGATAKLCEFLINSNVSSIDFTFISGLDGAQFAEAIVKCAGRMKSLAWYGDSLTQTAALQLFQVMQVRGNVLYNLNIDALPGAWFLEALAAVLTHENCRLHTLWLWSSWLCIRDNPKRLLQLFNGKHCSLHWLLLFDSSTRMTDDEKTMLESVRREFDQMLTFRHALLALLSGQQVSRLKARCSLRRLPVEMFRLVKEMLS